MSSYPEDDLSCSLPAAPPGRAPARPLVPTVLAFMAGLLAASWGLVPPRSWALPVAAGFWLAMAAGWWRGSRLLVLPLAFFGALGAAMYGQAREPVLPPDHLVHLPQEQDLSLMGRVVRLGRMGPDWLELVVAAEAWRDSGGWQPASGLFLVSLPRQEPQPVGSRLVARGRLKAPLRLKNPASFDRPRHLAADGVFRILTLRHPDDLVWLAGGGDSSLKERLRGGVRVALRPLAPAPRAMYTALLLGDQREITPAMRDAFSRTGTSHLMVISGLHLGAVASLSYILCFWLLRRFPWLLLKINALNAAALMAAGAVVGYAWLVGGSPATQRAEIMVLAYLFLLFLGRPREVWSALALAALLILVMSPLRLFSPSFALSFAAVAGILYLVPRFGLATSEDQAAAAGSRGWLGQFWRWGGNALAVSLAASLATAPLVAWFFNIVSFLGILVNLVAIPLVLLLALPLGEMAVLAQAMGFLEAARGLIWLGQWPLWLGWRVIEQTAALPGAAFFCPTPNWLQMGLYSAVLLLLFARSHRGLCLGGAALAGVALLLSITLPGKEAPGGCEITVLDSPGGLSALVVAPDGARLAVSAGWPAYPGREDGQAGILSRFLHARQFRRLAGVAALTLTPANAPDLLEVARQFRVERWSMARGGEVSEAAVSLVNLLGQRRQEVEEPGRSAAEWQWGGMVLTFIPGQYGAGLEVAWADRRVVFLPPLAQAAVERLEPKGQGVLEAVVAARPPSPGWLARHRPRRLFIYGRPDAAAGGEASISLVRHSRAGALTLRWEAEGVEVSQWSSSR